MKYNRLRFPRAKPEKPAGGVRFLGLFWFFLLGLIGFVDLLIREGRRVC